MGNIGKTTRREWDISLIILSIVNASIWFTHDGLLKYIFLCWTFMLVPIFVYFKKCPLEILFRYKWKYFKIAKRAYGKKYYLSLLFYGGYVISYLIFMIFNHVKS